MPAWKRPLKRPPMREYSQAQSEIFQKQTRILSAVLPHAGERGKNDEERFRSFLVQCLPQRFSVGTGFVVCSNADVKDSAQTDIVIFDHFSNAPLYRELAAAVYAVESVYGVIEVKAVLTRKELGRAAIAIRRIRDLANHKHYLFQQWQLNEDKTALQQVWVEGPSVLSPRSYVVAYSKRGWRTIGDFADYIYRESKATGAFFHGVLVMDKEWFVFQHAKTGKTHYLQGHGLHNFLDKLFGDISMYPMKMANFSRYMRDEEMRKNWAASIERVNKGEPE